MNADTYNYLFNILKDIKYEEQDHWNIFDKNYYKKVKDILFFKKLS